MKLSDLDTIIDRRGSGCLKYDFALQRGKPADVLPFWVADMDFKVAQPILDALVIAMLALLLINRTHVVVLAMCRRFRSQRSPRADAAQASDKEL